MLKRDGIERTGAEVRVEKDGDKVCYLLSIHRSSNLAALAFTNTFSYTLSVLQYVHGVWLLVAGPQKLMQSPHHEDDAMDEHVIEVEKFHPCFIPGEQLTLKLQVSQPSKLWETFGLRNIACYRRPVRLEGRSGAKPPVGAPSRIVTSLDLFRDALKRVEAGKDSAFGLGSHDNRRKNSIRFAVVARSAQDLERLEVKAPVSGYVVEDERADLGVTTTSSGERVCSVGGPVYDTGSKQPSPDEVMASALFRTIPRMFPAPCSSDSEDEMFDEGIAATPTPSAKRPTLPPSSRARTKPSKTRSALTPSGKPPITPLKKAGRSSSMGARPSSSPAYLRRKVKSSRSTAPSPILSRVPKSRSSWSDRRESAVEDDGSDDVGFSPSSTPPPMTPQYRLPAGSAVAVASARRRGVDLTRVEGRKSDDADDRGTTAWAASDDSAPPQPHFDGVDSPPGALLIGVLASSSESPEAQSDSPEGKHAAVDEAMTPRPPPLNIAGPVGPPTSPGTTSAGNSPYAVGSFKRYAIAPAPQPTDNITTSDGTAGARFKLHPFFNPPQSPSPVGSEESPLARQRKAMALASSPSVSPVAR